MSFDLIFREYRAREAKSICEPVALVVCLYFKPLYMLERESEAKAVSTFACPSLERALLGNGPLGDRVGWENR